jgi:hypothetical protein
MKMKNLIAACFAGAIFALGIGGAAVAQVDVDPAVIHEGAAEYQNPSLDPADVEALNDIARAARSEQYSNDAVDGGVSVPWGDFLAELFGLILGGAAVFATYLLRQLPKTVVDALDAFGRITLQKNASEFLELCIGYGINTTQNAVRGKTMSVRVGSEVVERSVEYALRHAPGLVRKMGGLLQLREKLIARLDIEGADAFTAARPPIVDPLTTETPTV